MYAAVSPVVQVCPFTRLLLFQGAARPLYPCAGLFRCHRAERFARRWRWCWRRCTRCRSGALPAGHSSPGTGVPAVPGDPAIRSLHVFRLLRMRVVDAASICSPYWGNSQRGPRPRDRRGLVCSRALLGCDHLCSHPAHPARPARSLPAPALHTNRRRQTLRAGRSGGVGESVRMVHRVRPCGGETSGR